MSITSKLATAGRDVAVSTVSGEGYRPGQRPSKLAIATVGMLFVFAYAAFFFAPGSILSRISFTSTLNAYPIVQPLSS